MANTDKKRRAEKDLKELWQYIDAKYFLKFNKFEIIQKIDQIAQEIGTANLQKYAKHKLMQKQPVVGMSSRETLGSKTKQKATRQSSTKFGLVSYGSDLPEEQEYSDDEVMLQQTYPRKIQKQEYKTYGEMAEKEESILNEQNLDAKGGYKQAYKDMMEKIDVQSNWRHYIQKDTQGVEYQVKLDKNVLQSKVRNIFDIEFNKKFQGSLTIPLTAYKARHPSQNVPRPSQNRSFHPQQGTGTHQTGSHLANKYLVFISDKFETDKSIEEREKQMIQARVTTERLHERIKLSLTKEFTSESSSEVLNGGGLGFMSSDKTNENLGFTEEGITAERLLEEHGNMIKDLLQEATLDDELEQLEKVHAKAQEQLQFDLNQLKKKVVIYKEPDSVRTLETKIDKERLYLQNSIIQMEIKQVAESITRVTHAKKIPSQKILLPQSLQEDISSQLLYEQIGQVNRPLVLNRQLKNEKLANPKNATEHVFRLEFDESSGIPATWIDTKTLNFFNNMRDNIFASSGQYDLIPPPQNQQTQNKQDKKKDQNKPKPVVVKDKHSVAYQRGKRSCTLADLTENKTSAQFKQQILNAAAGKKSVGALKAPPTNLQQAANYSEYDFCHHCKQLKNKYLLVSCKYSSKNYRSFSSNHQGNNIAYAPYPYEPQCYNVNNVKIHNADFQNRSQIRGLIESIKKDLKHKNQAVEGAKEAMHQFLSEGHSSDQPGTENFDMSTFQQNNQHLMAWLQELDINPYVLDPYCQKQLTSDLKILFPNLYQGLYVTQKQQKSIDYECKRKFCTFCLRTNYEDNINDIMKNKNWHCHHCTGYCICTRCQRQDITTQLKAYLISLGGNLNTLRDSSTSIFDQYIMKNFNEHLELTLGQNQQLYEKYPYYLPMLKGKEFHQPANSDLNTILQLKEQNYSFDKIKDSFYDSKGKITPTFMKQHKRTTPDFLIKNSHNPENNEQDFTKLGFMSQLLPDAPNTHRAIPMTTAVATMPKNDSDQLQAISLLFRYSMLSKKIDDPANVLCQGLRDFSQQISDKRLMENIVRSLRKHETDLVSKIQKRRGRKRFILSNEDHSTQDSVFQSCLNKRDQKYLKKVAQMAEHKTSLADLREYQADWPKTAQKPLQQITKLLNQFGLAQEGDSPSDVDSSGSPSAHPITSQRKTQKSNFAQKHGNLSLNQGKRAQISNAKTMISLKEKSGKKSKKKRGKTLKLRDSTVKKATSVVRK